MNLMKFYLNILLWIIICFNDLNFNFNKQEINALVGESGCGKSTIISLLLRFYSPDTGSINLNNINLEEIEMYPYRKDVG